MFSTSRRAPTSWTFMARFLSKPVFTTAWNTWMLDHSTSCTRSVFQRTFFHTSPFRYDSHTAWKDRCGFRTDKKNRRTGDYPNHCERATDQFTFCSFSPFFRWSGVLSSLKMSFLSFTEVRRRLLFFSFDYIAKSDEASCWPSVFTISYHHTFFPLDLIP